METGLQFMVVLNTLDACVVALGRNWSLRCTGNRGTIEPCVFVTLYVRDIIVMLITDPGSGNSLRTPHPIIDDREVFK